MQIAQKPAAAARPVEREPRAPVERTPLPAQIQARETHHDERNRACAHHVLADRARCEPAMRLHDKPKEPGPARLAQQFARIRIRVPHFAAPGTETACTVRFCSKHHPRRMVARSIYRERDHALFRMSSLNARKEFDRREQGLGFLRDGDHAGIERVQDLVLEGEAGAGDTHHSKHDARAHADCPVNLKPCCFHKTMSTGSALRPHAQQVVVELPLAATARSRTFQESARCGGGRSGSVCSSS